MIARALRVFGDSLAQLPRVDLIRFLVCKVRWLRLKRNMRILPSYAEAVGEQTVAHNLMAFNTNAVFRMGNRMALLLLPLAALLRERPNARVLIVGPRSEDDIVWARALGLRNTTGLDLMSYSPWISLGDIHDPPLPHGHYDAILLAWMLSYTRDPKQVIAACQRLLKPDGFLGAGIEANPALSGVAEPSGSPRVNTLNSADDLLNLLGGSCAFRHDPPSALAHECAVIVKLSEPSHNA